MQQLLSPPYLMDAATKLAHTSPYGRFKLGAVIAQKRKVISMGTNRKKTHPLQDKYAYRPHLNSWCHAEIHAISLALAGDLVGSDVYVSRVLSNGSMANSRPCPGCESALKDYGIRRMFYWQNGNYYCEPL
jgi:tRNA(Arg) A34 adenosine deaminase TadA